jgi:hypothetical protein
VKIRLPEVGPGEIGAGQVAAFEIHPGKVATRTFTRAAGEELRTLIATRGVGGKRG